MPVTPIESIAALRDYVGREVATSDWLDVSQERINQFAEATEDRQWIHVDPEGATRESPYHATIAHGFLTLSLISRLMKDAIRIGSGIRLAVNYGLNRVRFPCPVHAGSRIRGRFSLLAMRDCVDAREIVVSCSVECEGSEKPCCVAEWIVRYYK